jgi:hypothetical protein
VLPARASLRSHARFWCRAMCVVYTLPDASREISRGAMSLNEVHVSFCLPPVVNKVLLGRVTSCTAQPGRQSITILHVPISHANFICIGTTGQQVLVLQHDK